LGEPLNNLLGPASLGGPNNDLVRLVEALAIADSTVRLELSSLLSAEEVRAVGSRASALADVARFPEADPDRREYPWPPV